jgi:hypothetical protein
MTDAPRNTNEAAAFLRNEHESGSREWKSLCQSLQRQARGVPAVYPSALSSAMHTPASERVHKIADLRRGMVAYSDHPSDSNPFGHVYFIIGRKKGSVPSDPSGILTWTNLSDGRVGVVPLSYFLNSWGDPFQFGATWINGFNFADFDAPPKPDRPSLGDTFQHAMEDIRKSIRFHEGKGHPALVRALKRDLARMEKRWEHWTD